MFRNACRAFGALLLMTPVVVGSAGAAGFDTVGPLAKEHDTAQVHVDLYSTDTATAAELAGTATGRREVHPATDNIEGTLVKSANIGLETYMDRPATFANTQTVDYRQRRQRMGGDPPMWSFGTAETGVSGNLRPITHNGRIVAVSYEVTVSRLTNEPRRIPTVEQKTVQGRTSIDDDRFTAVRLPTFETGAGQEPEAMVMVLMDRG